MSDNADFSNIQKYTQITYLENGACNILINPLIVDNYSKILFKTLYNKTLL